MNIEITNQDQVALIHLSGQVNGRSAPLIQEEALRHIQPGAHILMDMSQVSYMSSAGLRMLLLLTRQITAADSKLILVGLPEELADTMAITGFLPFFEVYNTTTEGLNALKS